MLDEASIQAESLEALKKLGNSGLMNEAYLAGGTAVALYFGHRESVDLDFFTREEFNARGLVRQLEELGEFEEDRVARRTVLGQFEGVKFSYFHLEYPLLDKGEDFYGIDVASEKDLAVMKLRAISDRGTRRDFMDMYFLCVEGKMELEDVFGWYGGKYGELEDKKYHLLRALNYFEDAEVDPELNMFVEVDWDEVKEYFRREVKRLAGEWGLLG